MSATPAVRELVVLVHGLGRTKLSMTNLARALEREGYSVLNWGYSSTSYTIAELGERLHKAMSERGFDYDRVHFVGHSLGTVIIRSAISQHSIPRVGRIVMLAPPNQGSQAADRFADWWGWLLKPLPELKTEPNSTARTIPVAPEIEVGVIAGQFDGKVSVAETRMDGRAEHVVVPATHTWLMRRKDVQKLTLDFMRNGSFGLAEQ